MEPKNCYQKHVPISVGIKLVSNAAGVLDNEPYETYTNDDVAVWFLNRLLAYREMIFTYLFDDQRLVMTDANQDDFDSAFQCYICHKPFPVYGAKFRKGQSKVRDHDHLTGAYRGAAHSSCNLKLRKTYKIPVFLHNFRGYDSHLIVPAFTEFKGLLMKVIGQGLEKYLTLTWDSDIVFKDSLQFLNGRLELLVDCLLKSGKDKFHQLNAAFENVTDEEGIDMLLRKGVYPYDYVGSVERFDERELPTREAFFNRLTNQECSEADYNHAQKVWQKFKCERFLDYHNLYLKTDVLLLADVFESFRNATLSTLGLDPAYYVSAPQLSWDCMMKMTGCQLTLLSDPAMFTVINTNLRGGICMISKRYAKANNRYMGDAYDPTEPESYILYVDANNLYGMAMSEPLPYDEFKWMSAADCADIDWTAQTVDQLYGYFVECDLHYPDQLHDQHNDYPLAPERLTVEDYLLSDKQVGLRGEYTISHTASSKLIPNFFDKTKIMLHYRNLQFYLLHGMELTKVHRVIKFKQARWLEPYIRTNTELRALTQDPVEIKLRKDMNNVIYGKTCENLTKRTDIKLVNTEKECQKLIRKPHCLRFQIFAHDLVGIEMQKVKCLINKPTYVGFTVLELSKLHMYKFHYDHLKQWYPEADLLFTDTDSLVYHIRTDDLYTELAAHREHFDFANYPIDHPSYGDENKMAVGKMKDEAAGNLVSEFVGLRPKMYSYTTIIPDKPEPKEAKRAKGIQRAAMVDIRHADYLAQLQVAVENYVNIRRIGQKHHRVFTVEGVKRGLCAFDDKRYLLGDGIHTYAHGHYKIREEQTRPLDLDVETMSIPVSRLLDEDDMTASNYIAVSNTEAVQRGVQPHVSRSRVMNVVSGMDLRSALSVVPVRDALQPSTSTAADITTIPKRGHPDFRDFDNFDEDSDSDDDDMRGVFDLAKSVAYDDSY